MPREKRKIRKIQKKINQRLKKIAQKRPNATHLVELISNICHLCDELFDRDDSEYIQQVLISPLEDLASILKNVVKNKDNGLGKVFRFSEMLLGILEVYIKDKDTAHKVEASESRTLDSTIPPIEYFPQNPSSIEEGSDEASIISALRSDVSAVYDGHVQALIDLHQRFIVDSFADEKQPIARRRASSRSSYRTVLQKTSSIGLSSLSSFPEEPCSSAATYYAEGRIDNVYARIGTDEESEDDDKESVVVPQI